MVVSRGNAAPAPTDGEQQAGILERVETGGEWAEPESDAAEPGEPLQSASPALIAHRSACQPKVGPVGSMNP